MSLHTTALLAAVAALLRVPGAQAASGVAQLLHKCRKVDTHEECMLTDRCEWDTLAYGCRPVGFPLCGKYSFKDECILDPGCKYNDMFEVCHNVDINLPCEDFLISYECNLGGCNWHAANKICMAKETDWVNCNFYQNGRDCKRHPKCKWNKHTQTCAHLADKAKCKDFYDEAGCMTQKEDCKWENMKCQPWKATTMTAQLCEETYSEDHCNRHKHCQYHDGPNVCSRRTIDTACYKMYDEEFCDDMPHCRWVEQKKMCIEQETEFLCSDWEGEKDCRNDKLTRNTCEWSPVSGGRCIQKGMEISCERHGDLEACEENGKCTWHGGACMLPSVLQKCDEIFVERRCHKIGCDWNYNLEACGEVGAFEHLDNPPLEANEMPSHHNLNTVKGGVDGSPGPELDDDDDDVHDMYTEGGNVVPLGNAMPGYQDPNKPGMGVMDPVLTGDDDEIGVVRDDVEVPGAYAKAGEDGVNSGSPTGPIVPGDEPAPVEVDMAYSQGAAAGDEVDMAYSQGVDSQGAAAVAYSQGVDQEPTATPTPVPVPVPEPAAAAPVATEVSTEAKECMASKSPKSCGVRDGCEWDTMFKVCLGPNDLPPCNVLGKRACKTMAIQDNSCKWDAAIQLCWETADNIPCDRYIAPGDCPADYCKFDDASFLCLGKDEAVPCSRVFDVDQCKANSDRCMWRTHNRECMDIGTTITCDMQSLEECTDSPQCGWHTDDAVTSQRSAYCIDKLKFWDMPCADYNTDVECQDSDHCEWLSGGNICIPEHTEVTCDKHTNEEVCHMYHSCQWVEDTASCMHESQEVQCGEITMQDNCVLRDSCWYNAELSMCFNLGEAMPCEEREKKLCKWQTDPLDCHWSKEFDICLSKNTDTNTMNCELLTFRMQCAVRDDCRFAEKPHKCVALDKMYPCDECDGSDCDEPRCTWHPLRHVRKIDTTTKGFCAAPGQSLCSNLTDEAECNLKHYKECAWDIMLEKCRTLKSEWPPQQTVE